MRGNCIAIDEAISCRSPEIATLSTVARNDDAIVLTTSSLI
ncbi:hypothetical protein [Rickettsia felis]|nr:hypothetical protein [Rickettsia felis]